MEMTKEVVLEVDQKDLKGLKDQKDQNADHLVALQIMHLTETRAHFQVKDVVEASLLHVKC